MAYAWKVIAPDIRREWDIAIGASADQVWGGAQIVELGGAERLHDFDGDARPRGDESIHVQPNAV